MVRGRWEEREGGEGGRYEEREGWEMAENTL